MKRLGGRLLALAAICGIAVALSEAAIRLGDLFASEREMAFLGPPGGRADDGSEPSGADAIARLHHTLHPYRGFATRLGRRADFASPVPLFASGEPSDWAERNRWANELGFHSMHGDYREIAEDDFAVAIVGGSVASEVAIVGGGYLVAALEAREPALAGRVRILNLADGGYKQPQQVMTLAEAIVLGVAIDIVVNLDGFNEVALGGVNTPRGWSPLLPSGEQYGPLLAILLGRLQRGELAAMAGALVDRERARALVAWVEGSTLGELALVRAFVGSLAQRAWNRAILTEQALQASLVDQQQLGVLSVAHEPCMGREEGCWELIADHWERSSRLLDRMASAIGADYLHVLQPSQYAPGGKVLTETERALAFRPDDDWSLAVRRGYPLLLSRVPGLVADGVEFRDWSNFFRDRSDTIYRDPCCHTNETGNRLLAEAIAGAIQSLPARGAARRSPTPPDPA